MSVINPVGKAKARLAVEIKKNKRVGGEVGAPAVVNARRDLAEQKLRQYIERTVAAAPPLSAEQLDRLAALLRGAVDTR